eukprot:TRINITY_DN122300_c0_g1_i1.p1 TRINITY_DN122300_c0_g1~~TRINITY_DN122300_c0_g1_i1.p1  ORF type:complete len:705 (-),score=222.94 TRINITY_DN122300_c0_g1_i1:93-2207(-)
MAAPAPAELPVFEAVNFDDLSELLTLSDDLANTTTNPVVLALGRGVTETERLSSDIDSRLEVLEEESIQDYVDSFCAFEELHHEIQSTDKILANMEQMLGSFQSDLSGISDEIKNLQGDSLSMNVKLRNRRALQSLMTEYVTSVVVSPQLVRQITEEEINETYLDYTVELNKKLEHVKQNDMQRLPSCAQSTPELERLRTIAVSRIKDFLLQKVNSLKTPKTNLQILQRNVLVRFKFFNTFLAEHHPAVGEEIKQHYVSTMASVYLKQFKTYVQNLSRLELENAPTKNDLLVAVESQTSIFSLLGGPSLKSKGNVFSISGRDNVLKELDNDPMIAHTQKDKAKYYHEQVFRSHQMLLMDAATSEFLFLKDFFNTQGDPALFTEVFSKTTQFFLESLEVDVRDCWDSVGLLLMIRIVEYYRKSMQTRQMSCLDSYLDALLLQLWPRLRAVLEANVASLRKAYQQGVATPANTHTHPVARRYAELAASIYALSTPEAGGLQETLQQPLQAMQQEIRALLQSFSAKFESHETGLVFLVNNYDLILTVFHERHLPRAATIAFEELLRDQVSAFVENQLTRHYPELLTYVKNTEPLVADIDESAGRQSSASAGPPAGVDVAKMEQVVKKFAANWKPSMDRINVFVKQSFNNLSNGMEILKQALTQLLLYYTRFQKILDKSFPQQRPAFAHELVSTTTILMEIKQVSKGF